MSELSLTIYSVFNVVEDKTRKVGRVVVLCAGEKKGLAMTYLIRMIEKCNTYNYNE